MRLFAFTILIKTYTLALTVLPKIAVNNTFTLDPPANVSDANDCVIGNSTSL